MSFSEVEIPPGADDALAWAIRREFELRERRREGLVGAIRRVVEPLRRLAEQLRGIDADPTIPYSSARPTALGPAGPSLPDAS